MIYFLFGEDKFRLLQKEKTLIEAALSKGYSFIERAVFDATSADFAVFWDLLFQKSIFSSNKVVVLRNVLENESFKKQLLKKMEEFVFLEDIIILSQFGKVKTSESLFKKLQKAKANIEDFSLLTGNALNSWIKEETTSLGAEIDDSSVAFLKRFCSSDLFCLSSEIKKLACFTNKINQEAMALLSFKATQVDIFSTLDSFSSKNKKKALALLQEHLDKGERPLYLLSMFAYQARNLILVKQFFSLGVFKLGMSYFVFTKLARLRDNFSLAELKKFFFAIFECDYKIKTGKALPEQTLFDLVVSV